MIKSSDIISNVPFTMGEHHLSCLFLESIIMGHY